MGLSTAYTWRAFIIGIGSTHLIALFHLYFSNISLYEKLTSIAKADAQVVPNLITMPVLLDISSAFWAGTFISISLGSSLTTVFLIIIYIQRTTADIGKAIDSPSTYTANQLDKQPFRTKRLSQSIGAFFLLLWFCFLIYFYFYSQSLILLSYFILVPSCLLSHHLWRLRDKRFFVFEIRDKPVLTMLYLLPGILIVALIASQIDKDDLLNIRDFSLLEHNIGKKVNQFYYRYTLFASEAIKPLHQKTMKSAYIIPTDHPKDKERTNSIKNALSKAGYTSIGTSRNADILVKRGINNTLLITTSHSQTTITQAELRTSPHTLLKAISIKDDNLTLFRAFIMFSFLIALPIIAFFACHRLAVHIGTRFFKRSNPLPIAITSTLILIAFTIPFSIHSSQTKPPQYSLSQIDSTHWKDRVAALRYIHNNQLDIIKETSSIHLLSPHIGERYWYAMALSHGSPSSTKNQHIIQLLNDPSINVVCAAIVAIGAQGGPKAKERIAHLLNTSPHWYVQWYAYRALLLLGSPQKNVG